MWPGYEDIRSLTDRDPDWFDQNGTPRYAPFSPGLLGVYDTVAVLAEVVCPACSWEGKVGIGWPEYEISASNVVRHSTEDLVRRCSYGDAPRHGCVGDTMVVDIVSIEQAWERRGRREWERRPDLEGPQPD